MGTSIFWENNRRRYKGKGRKDDVGNWFTIDTIGEDTFMISEYRHWEETHAYLLNGSERVCSSTQVLELKIFMRK